MVKIVIDATVLSNFLLVKRLDILQKALVNLCTTFEVIEEINFGVERELMPTIELGRVEVLEMSSEEREFFFKVGYN
nr:hypothetical protein [Candidatus Freyarchaeota archaeon]